MHLSLLVLILSKISFFKKNWLIILFLWFYAFLVGFTPSILRSVLFFTFKILIKKNISNLKLLIIVMEIMLLKNPFYIYDIGFIYSFLISFGLLTYQFVKTTKFQNLLKISIFIFFLSLPITAINFYKINFLTIILNIILIPLVSSIIYPLALLTFIFPIFNNVFNGFITLLIFINKLGEMFKFGILVIPKVTIFIWLIYYYLFFQAFYLRRCLYFFALLFLLFLIHIYPYFTTDLNISYLSVGQGDCTLLVSPKLKDVILIDTGGTFQLKKELWAESKTKNYQVDNITTYLNSLGINHIDTLILTHGDYDHAGNASELLSKFSVKKVIFNNDSYNDLEKSLINQLEKQNIPYINQITSLNFGNYQLNFLVTDLSDNENDNSNVIYFKYQQYQFLFMGDASKNREMAILNKYNLKNIDFLKVGHHGSDTSSGKDFISKIKPKYSIISVGLNNRYNHPKESVLNILANSKIYRTDQDGSIIIKFHNHNYQIFTKNDYT